MSIPVTAVFDIGKTNKKFVLFDPDYNEVYHEYQSFEELDDDDGDPCDDLQGIEKWMKEVLNHHVKNDRYDIKKLNFATYGATMVHLGEDGKPVTPLYNYLKPFPAEVEEKLFRKVNMERNDVETASPYLGMLNTGLQLFWLKEAKPQLFSKIRHSLYLPQYFYFLFTGQKVTEITSIGCHTKMWNFQSNLYHNWLKEEKLLKLLPDIVPTSHSTEIIYNNKKLEVGVGIHDSSSALATYLLNHSDPFILISTGTWSITLNPFTREQITHEELKKDCLQYMNIYGKPVKASRLFIGNEFQQQLSELNDVFEKSPDYYKSVRVDPYLSDEVSKLELENKEFLNEVGYDVSLKKLFDKSIWNPYKYPSFEEAYHFLNGRLVLMQRESLKLAKGKSDISNVFLDGGFASNEIFVSLLKASLPSFQISLSNQAMGTAHGAAMIIS